jgi:hypothetical protein
MRYLCFKQDVLIFTDAHRTVGCIIDDSRYPNGHPVTSGFLRLLETTLFDPKCTETPSNEALQRAGLAAEDQDRDLAGFDSFLFTSPSISWDSVPQPLGHISTEEFSNDAVISLNGDAVWCPSGVLAKRPIGEATVCLAVSPMDLRGSVQTDQRVLASPLSAAGPDLRLVTASDCGVCGLCGVCAICAEINAATPAGATVAITALGELQNMPSPADRRALIEAAYRREYAAERQPKHVG